MIKNGGKVILYCKCAFSVAKCPLEIVFVANAHSFVLKMRK